MHYQEVINFWFEEIEPKQIWVKDADFDQLIRDRFLKTYEKATRCELFSWRKNAQGRLAEIIVLDQFSRNMFRDSAQAFKFDSLALALSQEAIALEFDKELESPQRGFIYLPLMHSESRVIHEYALKIYTQNSQYASLEYEIKHKNIIDKFSRYPHRNAVLGRTSTAEEIEFLTQPGSSF